MKKKNYFIKRSHQKYFYVFLICIYFIVYWRRMVFLAQLPADGDFFRLVIPTWTIGKRLLMENFSFLWDPFRLMGIPFLANPPNQALYPFRILSLFFDFFSYMRLYILFHAALMVGGTYLLVWDQYKDKLVAFYAGVAMGFNGFVLSRITVTVDFATMAWIPLLIFLIHRRSIICFSLVLAIQWMAGYPPFFILSCLILLIYTLASVQIPNRVAFLAAGVGLGLGLSSISLIPFAELLRMSARPLFLSMKDVLSFSLHPLELLRQLVIPAPFVNWIDPINGGDQAVTGFYFGPIILFLFAWGMIKGGRTEKYFGLAALGALFLSMGRYSGIYSHLPFLSFFRFPGQWLLVMVVFFVLVSITGFQKVRSSRIKIGLLGFVLLDLLVFSLPIRTLWADKEFMMETPAKVAVVKDDLGDRRIFHTASITDLDGSNRLGSLEDWLEFFKEMVPSIGVSQGYREVWSRHNMVVQRQLEFKNELDRLPSTDPHYDWAGISKIIDLKKSNDSETSRKWGTVSVTDNPNSWGRITSLNNHEIRNQMLRPGRIEFEIDGPGAVVINETNLPGWRARVDGAPVPIKPFGHIFMGLELPAGAHSIVLRYFPFSFILGFIFSVLFGLVLFGIFLFERRAQRKLL